MCFSFFRFLVKYFQLCTVISLLPFVVNKAYHNFKILGWRPLTVDVYIRCVLLLQLCVVTDYSTADCSRTERQTDRQTDGRTEINSVVTLYFSKSTESYDRIPSCVCASPCRLRCRHINLFWLTAWLIGGVMLAVGTLQDSREFHITFYVWYCLRHKLDQFLYHVHLTHHQQPH